MNIHTKTFYLIRHGHTNNSGTFDHQSTTSLNEEGKAASMRLAKWLQTQSIDSLYSSPTTRSMETAQIISNHLNLSVNKKSDFQEINFGDWQGKTFQEIYDQHPGYIENIIEQKE